MIVWDVDSGKAVHELEGYIFGVSSVSISPDGHFISSGSEGNTVIVWDVESGKVVYKLDGHRGGVTSVSVSYFEIQNVCISAFCGNARVMGDTSGQVHILKLQSTVDESKEVLEAGMQVYSQR